jgi:hypothetical protein
MMSVKRPLPGIYITSKWLSEGGIEKCATANRREPAETYLALADPEADLVVKAAGRSPPNRQFLEVHRDSIAQQTHPSRSAAF